MTIQAPTPHVRGAPARAGADGDATVAVDFSSLGLDARLLAAVRDRGFTMPTPIQLQAIPVALQGRDVLGTAMTGSGKTAAFLLPILQRLLTGPHQRTRALVVTPTRELAAQIVDHFEGLARGLGIRGAAIFGGVNARPQEKAFRQGVEVLVATPGRLLDHLQNDYARLDEVEVLVLDEADRMLDMGFLPEVRKILRRLPSRGRQTLFFSATMPDAIASLAREMLRDPVRVQVQKQAAPPTTIEQALFPVPQERKVDLLVELLRREEMGSAIVFCRTKHRAKRLAKKLAQHGVRSGEIHGNRSQNQRTDALEGFRSGRYAVLVATDIVARGIDVEELEHVINFDVPVQPEDYIHRIGRTARAEASGEAYTFVAPDEEKGVVAIERALGRKLPRRTLLGFDYDAPVSERLEIPIAQRLAMAGRRRRR